MEFAYELAATYPNLVSVSSAGQSYEGREVRSLCYYKFQISLLYTLRFKFKMGVPLHSDGPDENIQRRRRNEERYFCRRR